MLTNKHCSEMQYKREASENWTEKTLQANVVKSKNIGKVRDDLIISLNLKHRPLLIRSISSRWRISRIQYTDGVTRWRWRQFIWKTLQRAILGFCIKRRHTWTDVSHLAVRLRRLLRGAAVFSDGYVSTWNRRRNLWMMVRRGTAGNLFLVPLLTWNSRRFSVSAAKRWVAVVVDAVDALCGRRHLGRDLIYFVTLSAVHLETISGLFRSTTWRHSEKIIISLQDISASIISLIKAK